MFVSKQNNNVLALLRNGQKPVSKNVNLCDSTCQVEVEHLTQLSSSAAKQY
jgi:hypothetical protein